MKTTIPIMDWQVSDFDVDLHREAVAPEAGLVNDVPGVAESAGPVGVPGSSLASRGERAWYGPLCRFLQIAC